MRANLNDSPIDPVLREHQLKRYYDLPMENNPLTQKLLVALGATLISINQSTNEYDLISAHAQVIIEPRIAVKSYHHRVMQALS